MRSMKPLKGPSAAQSLRRSMIVDRRGLHVTRWNMLPAGKIDRIIKPADVHLRKVSLELRERDRIARQDVDADERSARAGRRGTILTRPEASHQGRQGWQ